MPLPSPSFPTLRRRVAAALLAGAAALGSAAPAQASGPSLPRVPGHVQTAPPATEDGLRAATGRAARERAGVTAATLAATGQASRTEVKRRTADGRWAFGAVVLTAPPRAGAVPRGWLYLAQAAPGGWDVALEGDPAFARMAGAAPDGLLHARERRTFARSDATAPALASATRTGLGLPWSKGAAWTLTSGPHSFGGGAGVLSSVDFAGGDQVVRAARGGTAYAMCASGGYRGWIRVYHDNGYATDYYHLTGNITPADGVAVATGAFLGHTGNDTSCGGASTGRHVHFSLLAGGQYAAVDGREIGGWVLHAGAAPYQGTARHGSTLRGTGGTLHNHGPLSERDAIVDANDGASVNTRTGPGTGYALAGSRADGEIARVACTARGTTHTGRYGTTDLWNRLDTGAWISDAFVYTGSAGPVAPAC